jgi:hypothetical protein
MSDVRRATDKVRVYPETKAAITDLAGRVDTHAPEFLAHLVARYGERAVKTIPKQAAPRRRATP